MGLYYLQSRYYDPDLCRFLNADAFVSTGQGERGNNMFAYCLNNPLNYSDSCGTRPNALSDSIALVTYDYATNQHPVHLSNAELEAIAARIKFNSSTVNIYTDSQGEWQAGKINVQFYVANSTNGYINIHISPSLNIRTDSEMDAVLDLIMNSEYYSAAMFGTREFMKAQWYAHNICYDIASSGDIGFNIMSALSGSSNPITSSQALDIRCNGNMLKRQKIIYTILSWFIN